MVGKRTQRAYGRSWGAILKAAVLGLVIAGSTPGQDQGPAVDAAVRDRVAQLLERLSSPEPRVRETAADALLKLGPRILSLLPDSIGAEDSPQGKELNRVRSALREMEEQSLVQPSKISIQASGIRLSEAIRQIERQSGNPITDLREQLGDEVRNPSFDLNLQGVTFFEALDAVSRLGDVSYTAFTGDGSIGIIGGSPPSDPMVAYNGPFKVAFRQIAEFRDLQTGAASATAQFEVYWEPRLRPMLLSLKTESLVVTDDQGRPVAPRTMMESTETVLRPENPMAEIYLNLDAPHRSATQLSTFRFQAEITLPAGIRTFRFPNLEQPNQTLRQGEVAVTLRETEVDEQVWKVNVELNYPGQGEAFESYRQGLFNNRLWLQKADGTRFEHNGGFSNTASDGGRLGFEYLFVDVPGELADYALVYETPSRVTRLPLEVEFRQVPLP